MGLHHPKPYTLNGSFHFIFHYPNITPPYKPNITLKGVSIKQAFPRDLTMGITLEVGQLGFSVPNTTIRGYTLPQTNMETHTGTLLEGL